MKVYAEIPKGRGYALRVSQEHYQGHTRIDCRIWYETRPGDRDTLRPTPKGVNVGVRDLPAVLAALHHAATDALQAELLTPQDYTRAGLTAPDLPRKEAA